MQPRSDLSAVLNKMKNLMEEVADGELTMSDFWKYMGNLHDFIDTDGAALLHYSAKRGDAVEIQRLLDYGLDVNFQTNDGVTPLMLAAHYYQEEAVCVLLKANARIDITDNRGENIFDKLSLGIIKNTSIPGALLLKLLDKCETEEDAANKLFNARCPLHLAVLLKSSQIIEFFLQRGAENIVPSLPETLDRASALHFAVHFQDVKSAELLLHYGADINVKDSGGRAPIWYVREHQYCQKSEQLKILKCLLDRGADLTTQNTKLGYMQIYPILSGCSKEAVQLVLQANVDLQAKDRDGNTAMHYMAGNRNPGVLSLLPVDFDACNDDGWNALYIASQDGHVSTVQLLIDQGADVNFRASRGSTPLFPAVHRFTRYDRDIEAVELLLQYGADVQIVADDALTVFDMDADDSNFDLIQPVLAQLAILEATGTIIKNEIRANINLVARLKDSFNVYRRQLEQFKEIVVHESVTMFDLLTATERKFLVCLRNRLLVAKLEQVDCKNNQGVYYRKLRLRTDCGHRRVKFVKRATYALCKIMQICYDSYPTITDEICSCLCEPDLLRLGQI